MAEASDLTPMEWLVRLGKKLLDRKVLVDFWGRYYEGEADLPAGPNQHREVFRRFQKMARTNLCWLCAESRVHRTRAIGFSDPGWTRLDEIDPVWRLWQSAKLDARQTYIWRKAYSLSAGYVTVGPHPRKAKTPRVTIEGPRNVIVEHDPADASEILAALRLWYDDIARRWMATLYLPGEDPSKPGTRYAWQTRKPGGRDGGISWKPAMWEERDEPAPSSSTVPVVPFYHGDEGEEPYAAFAPGIDDQNRLNLTVLNRLSSERYAAFRQAILLNYQIEEDPVTGEPIAPWKPGVTQIGMVAPPDEPGSPEVKLVQLQQTETSGMLRGCESDMRAFASTTLTPVYYLPGDFANIGADAIAALDAGHNAEIKQGNAVRAEGLETVLQLMADIAELDRDLSASEIVFDRPENFLPAQVGDMIAKYVGAGMPLPMAVEEVGWSPQRVNRLRSEMAEQAFRESLREAAREPVPATQGGPPATRPPAEPAMAARGPAGSHDLG